MANIFRRRATSKAQQGIDSYFDEEEDQLIGTPGNKPSYSSLPTSDKGSVSVLAVMVALGIFGAILGLVLIGVV
jgi:hypothetical protein